MSHWFVMINGYLAYGRSRYLAGQVRDGNIARALTEQAHKYFAMLPVKGITIADFLSPFVAAIATRDIDIKSDAVTCGFTSAQKAKIPCCSDCEGQTGHQTAMQVYNSIVGSRLAFDEKGAGLDDETIAKRILHALHTGELLAYPHQPTMLVISQITLTSNPPVSHKNPGNNHTLSDNQIASFVCARTTVESAA